jgi:hypothetical protein
VPGQFGRRGPVRKNAARPTGEFGEPGGWTCWGVQKEDALIELVWLRKVNEDVLECVNNVEGWLITDGVDCPRRAALYEGSRAVRAWWRSTPGPKCSRVRRRATTLASKLTTKLHTQLVS